MLNKHTTLAATLAATSGVTCAVKSSKLAASLCNMLSEMTLGVLVRSVSSTCAVVRGVSGLVLMGNLMCPSGGPV